MSGSYLKIIFQSTKRITKKIKAIYLLFKMWPDPKRTDAHILFIHGDEDETVPLAQGQMLAGAGTPAKTHLWVVPAKGHRNCHTHPQFWEKVDTLLQKTLPVS